MYFYSFIQFSKIQQGKTKTITLVLYETNQQKEKYLREVTGTRDPFVHSLKNLIKTLNWKPQHKHRGPGADSSGPVHADSVSVSS